MYKALKFTIDILNRNIPGNIIIDDAEVITSIGPLVVRFFSESCVGKTLTEAFSIETMTGKLVTNFTAHSAVRSGFVSSLLNLVKNSTESMLRTGGSIILSSRVIVSRNPEVVITVSDIPRIPTGGTTGDSRPPDQQLDNQVAQMPSLKWHHNWATQ